MDIYLFSDDNYFSLGLQHLLHFQNRTLYVHSWSTYNASLTHKKFRHGDTVFLDTCSSQFIEKSIGSPIINCKVQVVLLYDFNKSIPAVFQRYLKLPKSTSVNRLLGMLSEIDTTDHGLDFCPGGLTARESIIIQRLYQQASYQDIARELDISHKTVSAHKINAFRKLGVRHFSQLYC